MAAHFTRAGELAKQLLNEYPTAGSLTLAKRLHHDYPEHFETVENARGVIRRFRGEKGKYGRRYLTDLSHVKDLDKLFRDRFSLPDPATSKHEPYVIPKANDRLIVFGDAHFPYQNNKGIYAALEYAARKSANGFVLNGDMIDMYQDSRFTKDGRKPNIEYEIEMLYEFLKALRESFPSALIVWKFGNHEERYDNYFKNAAPLHYMIGTSNLEDTMPLGDIGVQVVKDKRIIKAGDLPILHGHEFGGGAGQVNPARTMFLRAKTSVLVNHFHRSSQHMETDIHGKEYRAYSLGAMCARQDYAPYGNQNCSFGWLQIVDGVCWVTNREVS